MLQRLENHPHIAFSITFGFPLATVLAAFFYLFERLERAVGDRFIGIVFAVLVVAIAAVEGYIGFRIPHKARLALGVLGWLAVIVMLLLYPLRVR